MKGCYSENDRTRGGDRGREPGPGGGPCLLCSPAATRRLADRPLPFPSPPLPRPQRSTRAQRRHARPRVSQLTTHSHGRRHKVPRTQDTSPHLHRRKSGQRRRRRWRASASLRPARAETPLQPPAQPHPHVPSPGQSHPPRRLLLVLPRPWPSHNHEPPQPLPSPPCLQIEPHPLLPLGHKLPAPHNPRPVRPARRSRGRRCGQTRLCSQLLHRRPSPAALVPLHLQQINLPGQDEGQHTPSLRTRPSSLQQQQANHGASSLSPLLKASSAQPRPVPDNLHLRHLCHSLPQRLLPVQPPRQGPHLCHRRFRSVLHRRHYRLRTQRLHQGARLFKGASPLVVIAPRVALGSARLTPSLAYHSSEYRTKSRPSTRSIEQKSGLTPSATPSPTTSSTSSAATKATPTAPSSSSSPAPPPSYTRTRRPLPSCPRRSAPCLPPSFFRTTATVPTPRSREGARSRGTGASRLPANAFRSSPRMGTIRPSRTISTEWRRARERRCAHLQNRPCRPCRPKIRSLLLPSRVGPPRAPCALLRLRRCPPCPRCPRYRQTAREAPPSTTLRAAPTEVVRRTPRSRR